MIDYIYSLLVSGFDAGGVCNLPKDGSEETINCVSLPFVKLLMGNELHNLILAINL